MKDAKKLTIKEKARLKKIDKEIQENRDAISALTKHNIDLKNEKARMLCEYKIDEILIRDDGTIGRISKISLNADQSPSIFVQIRSQRAHSDEKFKTEHYRTKKTESWHRGAHNQFSERRAKI